MTFASFEFWGFLAIVVAVYACLAHRRQNLLLLAASYFFYGWWDRRFLGLILLSTAIDFYVGRRLDATRDDRESHARSRRRLLAVSVVANLGILGFFKYANFFADSLRDVALSVGVELSLPVLQIVLPVGISFYTFQSMAYTIDVFRGRARCERDPFTFALYVAYFPQLVAGPIERAGELLPRLRAPRVVTWQMLRTAACLILIGLFKKLVVADGVAPHVDLVFESTDPQASAALWRGAILFALQIYGDFSGYSDIARGVSLGLGIPLVRNFAQPYFATSIREFWRRWHISLSQWLRDYLYIPLGGNRGGPGRTEINLMTTMLLGGLWHGASWNFVLWGGLHGFCLVVHRQWEQFKKRRPSLRARNKVAGRSAAVAGWACTMSVVLIAWVFFRSPSTETSLSYVSGMLAFEGTFFRHGWFTVVHFGALVALVDVPARWLDDDAPFLRWPVLAQAVTYAVMFALLLLAGGPNNVPFIYFQF